MTEQNGEYVPKACAYITNTKGELLVFEGPGHDGLQIPKGTIEGEESPREAFFREVTEESGLESLGMAREVANDVWTRRESPPRYYVRHFFHAQIHEPRDEWTHTVTGEGEEVGADYEFRWVEVPNDHDFALDLDDYVHLLGEAGETRADAGVSESYS